MASVYANGISTISSRMSIAWLISVIVLVGAPYLGAKERSRFITAGMHDNVLANAEKSPWVRQQQEGAINAAKPWMDCSDEEL
jgi:hypothetical protein